MKGRLSAVVAAILGIMSQQQANAAAFALKEQSVTYLGNAYAGTASTAEDASTSYYNPAGMVLLNNSQAVLSGIYIDAQNKLSNGTATNLIGTAVTGNQPTKPKSHGFVPAGHVTWKLNNRYAVGLSVCAPFGLSTKYSNSDIARYMATESSIKTIDVSPTVSFKINDKFALGAGFDALHLKATLSADINAVGSSQGYVINKASGWAYGYHAGIIFKPSDLTQMGLVYFSKFTPSVNGTVETGNYTAITGKSAPTKLSASINLPEKLNYSVTHKYSDEWTAMGEIEWTHWSRLKKLTLAYNTGTSAVENLYYKNTYRFSLGANYKYSAPLTLKGGLSYEQSPVQDVYRTARLPDSTRYWLAFGAKYKVNKNVSIDAGYAHLFVKKASIAQRGVGDSRRLNGNYKSSADIVGIQLTWNFV